MENDRKFVEHNAPRVRRGNLNVISVFPMNSRRSSTSLLFTTIGRSLYHKFVDPAKKSAETDWYGYTPNGAEFRHHLSAVR